jgi:hypothetical protein
MLVVDAGVAPVAGHGHADLSRTAARAADQQQQQRQQQQHSGTGVSSGGHGFNNHTCPATAGLHPARALRCAARARAQGAAGSEAWCGRADMAPNNPCAAALLCQPTGPAMAVCCAVCLLIWPARIGHLLLPKIPSTDASVVAPACALRCQGVRCPHPASQSPTATRAGACVGWERRDAP